MRTSLKWVSFWKEKKKAFIEYAIIDAKITVKHATEMEKFNKTVRKIGIPITLYSIGRNYVATQWMKNFDKHLPHQIYGEFLMKMLVKFKHQKVYLKQGMLGYICPITMPIIRMW